MLFLAETTFSRPLEGQTRLSHRAWVAAALKSGRLIISGVLRPEDAPLMGCIIFSADSLADAQAFASSDPVMRDGLAQVTRVIEFEPHVRTGNVADALGDLVVVERDGSAPATP